ncbi:hypothetical protein [Saccharothrix obliqua]|uniref:hypothetical protein n=1 Tax=Saccharothrix obliqua TaxID=2861747 RepID=UPI001C5EC752|nr:hypothetical protein [Saccharothrix obliqua]MBW4717794.1 hypothetical protein [Saccharothrix obliqua]
MITVSLLVDDRMLLDGVTAWLCATADLRVVGAVTGVADLAGSEHPRADVVVVDLGVTVSLAAVRTLLRDGRRIVAVISPVAADDAARAGAHGVVARSAGLAGLASAIRTAAAGDPAPPPVPAWEPRLSEQERAVFVGYVSGLTLATAARRAGVRPDTAKKYLDRVKQKYTECGRATYTKLDLARRACEDGLVE